MNRLLKILLIISAGTFNTQAQEVDKNYIDNWVLTTFTGSVIGENTIYLLNGNEIVKDSIDIILSKYTQDDIIYISYIDTAILHKIAVCKPFEGIILMTSRGKIPKKMMRLELKITKQLFSKRKHVTINDSTLQEPVLIIDKVQISPKNCYQKIREIKVKDLIGLHYIRKPVNTEIYGPNGIHGLVIITKK